MSGAALLRGRLRTVSYDCAYDDPDSRRSWVIATVNAPCSAGPEDTFTVVFDGERAVGRVMLIDGEWDWWLRGVASGREPTRAKALRALAAAYGGRKAAGR